MSDAAIETRDLTKFYGQSRGIEGIDLRVERGEVFGFLGPNGAGKTTTIRLLLDLIRATRGTAAVCNCDSRAQSLEVRRRTGYLPGELRLPGRLSARDCLEYLAHIRGGVARNQIEELSDRLGLELDRTVDDLSKGNKEKVGVVAAFMHDPELLILDEPTSGLDPLRQEDVQELIRERSAAGRTVFLSSHALDQVEHVAGRVGIIKEGRLISVEEISALKRRALRHVEIRFAGAGPSEDLSRIPGVRDVSVKDGVVRLRVEGPMDALVKELARYPVQTLTSEEPELDEIFLAFYGRSHAG
ncbi:MAG TPA: ABC transporter ATP-binding protein [Solirubrobacterales bacterium]|nr:ABC transporter ATP-binding protein [Solirubrobacterales bacterium]